MKRILVAFLMLINICSKMDASEEMKKMAQQIKDLKELKDEEQLIKKEIKSLEEQRDSRSFRKIKEKPDLEQKILMSDFQEMIDALEFRLDILTEKIKIAQLKEKLEAERIALAQLKFTDKKQKNSIEVNIKKINEDIRTIESKVTKLEKSEDYNKNMQIEAKKIWYEIVELERKKKQLAKSDTEENKKEIEKIERDINARRGMIDARKPTPQELLQRKSHFEMAK